MEKNRKTTVDEILVTVPEYILKVKCDTDHSTPPFKCAVSSCNNFFTTFEDRDKYAYKFHNFPQNDALRQTWMERCSLPPNADVSKLKVCSDHFWLDNYIRNYKEEFKNPNFKRKLHADAIPSRNLHKAETSTPSCSWANNEVLNPTEVKEAVEENKTLKRKYDSLTRRKLELEHKIARSSKRITSKTRALASCHEELRKKSSKDQNLKTKINFVSKVFSDAQIKLLLGKKVFWSEDDLAKAFSLRHMGGKQCYLYLKNAMNMPLPALACVQKWAASGYKTT